MAKSHYGKDHPERFLDGALDGDIHGAGGRQFQDSMTSNEMEKYPVDRKSQHILTAFALDNVGRVYDRFESSMKDMKGIGGGPENLKHSLTGASAVQEHVGAAGHTKSDIIPNH
jgi:hypothetical protein